MPKNNQTKEILIELEKQLPEFTQEDIATLIKITAPYQEKIMKVIQDAHPQAYDWIKEKHQQLEEEKTDKEVESLKKSLANKE